VYELVHSEDREELQRQLMWNSFLPPESANIALQDVLQPENCHLLERSFTVRFRCLLDNTSGFLVSPLAEHSSPHCSVNPLKPERERWEGQMKSRFKEEIKG
jgi:hypothetical protein